ncbi:MAG TPA: hypothetical protein VKT73_09585 [Xanthobacteraceae bacterium]|nr:hypothetical protein [Xanthobacteraceae bacterium]
MTRALLTWLLIAIVGIAAPIAIWWFAIAGRGDVAVGTWHTSLAAGSADASMSTRNYVVQKTAVCRKL